MPRDTLPSHWRLHRCATPAVTVVLLSLFSTMVAPPASAAITSQADTTPPWRSFHGAAIVDTSMIIFGGTADPTTNPFGPLVPGSNDLWVWSTTLRQWSQPTTQFQSPATNTTTAGNAPSPQKFLTAFPTQSQGRMMAFVSNSSTGASNEEVLILDTHFWTWSIPTSPNPAVAPVPRLGAAVGTSNNYVYIHGGESASSGYASSGFRDDHIRMDDSTFEWMPLAGGPSLAYHTMCKMPGLNTMVCFGGIDGSGASSSLHTFDLDKGSWNLNVIVNEGAGGSIPSARRGHTAACLNDTMVIYGGGADQPQDDDVWVLDASVTPWVWNRMTTNKSAGPGPRTGHSALLNGTNMLVWGGYGAPMANDVNVYILDTATWRWSSSKDVGTGSAIPYMPSPSGPDSNSKNNMPMTIGVVCGSLALVAALVGFLVMRRRASRKNQEVVKHSNDNASYISDAERHLAGDLGLDDKPSYYHHHAGRDSGSSLGGWPNTAARRSIPQPTQGFPMRPLASPVPPIPTVTLETEEDIINQAGSSRSMELQSSQHQPIYTQRTSLRDIDQASQRSGAKVGSIGSDPYYPAHLAENDEEDADRWTFASSLSFDKREKSGQVPPLRYIPSRSSGVTGLSRSMAQSTGSLTPSFPANRSVRRDGSAPSILSRKGSALDSASIAMATGGTPTLNREGSISPRDTTTLFNSVSPLDRVSLMCSGLEIEPVAEEGGAVAGGSGFLDPRSSIVVPQWRSSASLNRDSVLEQTISEKDEIEGSATAAPSSLPQRAASVSTSYTSTGPTTLDHPAMITLIQNLPARYKVSKSPNPIHGRYNDIIYAVDTDTQQPIVIKSFGRRETWERECRTLRRLRGPCVVELKHVATLVLSDTDEPNNTPASKIRLTVLERLDETLAEMLQNAKAAKKVALRENAQEQEGSSATAESLERDLDLQGAGYYRTGPALDEGYIKDIVKGVLRCLTWCHSKKIVYCDLKPTNIMRNRDDTRQQWKFIDFEASRVADEECTSVGTVRYCPPEVANGIEIPATGSTQLSASVTARYNMDLWAFGCLVYELYATRSLIPVSATNEAVLHFLAHPSSETPALANGLRWANQQELEIPHFEQAVPNRYARQLIRILLHPDPTRRATMNQVLNSDFLN